jgi:hypothetical protein
MTNPETLDSIVTAIQRSTQLMNDPPRPRLPGVAANSDAPCDSVPPAKLSRRYLFQGGLGLLFAGTLAAQTSGAGHSSGHDGAAASGIGVTAHPSSPAVHASTDAALSALSATVHAYGDQTASAMVSSLTGSSTAGQTDAAKSVSAEDACDTSDDSADASMDPSGNSFSSVSSDARQTNSSIDIGPSVPTPESHIAITTQDLFGDFLGVTAFTLSCFKATDQQAAPMVDTAANLFGVYQATHEANTSSPTAAVPEIAASIGFDAATGLAAKSLATMVFETASEVVAPPVAVVYGAYAFVQVSLASNFVKSYLGNVTKSVLDNLSNEFAQKQSEIETGLYEYYNLPIVGRGF